VPKRLSFTTPFMDIMHSLYTNLWWCIQLMHNNWCFAAIAYICRKAGFMASFMYLQESPAEAVLWPRQNQGRGSRQSSSIKTEGDWKIKIQGTFLDIQHMDRSWLAHGKPKSKATREKNPSWNKLGNILFMEIIVILLQVVFLLRKGLP